MKNISTSQFEVKLQEQESDGSHVNEKVAYIAIEPGYGSMYGSLVEVGYTKNEVTDSWYTISFKSLFTSNPGCFIGQIQTYDGGDPSELRRKNLDFSGVKVKIEEEQSYDSETSHTTEKVGYMVIE